MTLLEQKREALKLGDEAAVSIQNLSQDLLSRFLVILNSKKDHIKELEARIAELESRDGNSAIESESSRLTSLDVSSAVEEGEQIDKKASRKRVRKATSEKDASDSSPPRTTKSLKSDWKPVFKKRLRIRPSSETESAEHPQDLVPVPEGVDQKDEEEEEEEALDKILEEAD
jgi:hypothetical protein